MTKVPEKRKRSYVRPQLDKALRKIRNEKLFPEKVWRSIKHAGGVEGTFIPPGTEGGLL